MKKILLIFILLCFTFTAYAEEVKSGIFAIDLTNATDEQLNQALAEIKAEQKSRIKTSIIFDKETIEIEKGKTVKIQAAVENIPEGVKAGTFRWESSDNKIATCKNGSINGAGPGDATITCKMVLSDGNELESTIKVHVSIPIKAIKIRKNRIEAVEKEYIVPEYDIKPKDASNTIMSYVVEDPSVVKIDGKGRLIAAHFGETNVSATTTDGSNITVSFSVSVKRLIGEFDDEILFQNLQWLSNEKQASSDLVKTGLVSSIGETGGSSGYAWPEKKEDIIRQYEDALCVYNNSLLDTKLGGHQAYMITLNYAYGTKGTMVDYNDSKLITVCVLYDGYYSEESMSDVFFDLLSQLEEKYGEFNLFINQDRLKKKGSLYNAAINHSTNHTVIKDEEAASLAATIYGKKHTGIALLYFPSRVYLIFGKTNASNILKEMDRVKQLEKESMDNTGL